MYGFKWLRNRRGSGVPGTERKKAAAETAIAKGDALIYSSGYLTPITAGSSAQVDAIALHAVAASAAGVNPDIDVIVPGPEDIFIASLANGSSVLQVADQANEGIAYETVGATGAMLVNEAATTTPLVRVEKVADSVYGDTSLVEVSFIAHKFQD